MASKTGLISSFERTKLIGKISISVRPAAMDFSACFKVSSRLGKPEDSANLISFLLSDQASYITGQIIKVDGGISLT